MTDRLVDTPAFREAVEAAVDDICPKGEGDRELWRGRVVHTLTTALPHLERHFREQLAGELRQRAAELEFPYMAVEEKEVWLDAADSVEGK